MTCTPRQKLSKIRWQRRRTMRVKGNELYHYGKAMVFVLIQYEDSEKMHAYHSHPDSDWPSKNWAQLRATAYPMSLYTPANMPIPTKLTDNGDGDIDIGDCEGHESKLDGLSQAPPAAMQHTFLHSPKMTPAPPPSGSSTMPVSPHGPSGIAVTQPSNFMPETSQSIHPVCNTTFESAVDNQTISEPSAKEVHGLNRSPSTSTRSSSSGSDPASHFNLLDFSLPDDDWPTQQSSDVSVTAQPNTPRASETQSSSLAHGGPRTPSPSPQSHPYGYDRRRLVYSPSPERVKGMGKTTQPGVRAGQDGKGGHQRKSGQKADTDSGRVLRSGKVLRGRLRPRHI